MTGRDAQSAKLGRLSAEIRALDVIVQRCLAKDARDRMFGAELAKDLGPALARCEGFDGPDLTLPDSQTI